MMARYVTAALILAGLVALALAANSEAATARHCPGTVRLSYDDIATRIMVRGIGCPQAKRAIKAPAPKRGYACTNPFDAPRGSGGYVRCSKGHVHIRFLYGQS